MAYECLIKAAAADDKETHRGGRGTYSLLEGTLNTAMTGSGATGGLGVGLQIAKAFPETKFLKAQLKKDLPDILSIPEHAYRLHTDPVYATGQALKGSLWKGHKGVQALQALGKAMPKYVRPVSAITGSTFLGSLLGNQAFHNYADN